LTPGGRDRRLGEKKGKESKEHVRRVPEKGEKQKGTSHKIRQFTLEGMAFHLGIHFVQGYNLGSLELGTELYNQPIHSLFSAGHAPGAPRQ
jgi:hypothetical protein